MSRQRKGRSVVLRKEGGDEREGIGSDGHEVCFEEGKGKTRCRHRFWGMTW
jgi:hypothetical protein